MKVAKWGNSLAVRLPVSVAESLGLKAGDEVEIRASGKTLEISQRLSKERAVEILRSLRRPIPPGYKFDRDEANAR